MGPSKIEYLCTLFEGIRMVSKWGNIEMRDQRAFSKFEHFYEGCQVWLMGTGFLLLLAQWYQNWQPHCDKTLGCCTQSLHTSVWQKNTSSRDWYQSSTLIVRGKISIFPNNTILSKACISVPNENPVCKKNRRQTEFAFKVLTQLLMSKKIFLTVNKSSAQIPL